MHLFGFIIRKIFLSFVSTIPLFVFCISPSWKEVKKRVKVRWSRYRPGVGRGIALLFHDRGTRRWWVVSITPWPHFILGKIPVPILQEAGLAAGPVWTGGKTLPHRNSIPGPSSPSQSLYRLSYRAHRRKEYENILIYWIPNKADVILDGNSFCKMKIFLSSQNCPIHPSFCSETW